MNREIIRTNFLTGFSIFTFPLSALNRNFYVPFVVNAIPIDLASFLRSVLWTFGVPPIVMSFVIPVVIIHEILNVRIGNPVHSLVKRLGVNDQRQVEQTGTEVFQEQS